MQLEKYSFGTGDRFGLEGIAQLKAIKEINDSGIPITPVWNKSNREHEIIDSSPADVRKEADMAINELKFKGNYFVDADHINLSNVDKYIEHSDFFTIDVSDDIDNDPGGAKLREFRARYNKYTGVFQPEGFESPYTISDSDLDFIGKKYIQAMEKGSEIYQHIARFKKPGTFITEVSIDETDQPQSPVELFFILAELGRLNVPVNTIAPKFSGRFNKGVDYEGDLTKFEKEFREDILVLKKAVNEFTLPKNLKLSIHSGSDKFSIYPVIGRLIKELNAGIHVKTAGTTWLEEIIGLAISGEEGLDMVKSFYKQSFERRDDLCAPYLQVIDIDPSSLPAPDEVDKWSGNQFADSVRHIPANKNYNPNIRQLMHVGYKVAAENKDLFLSLINKNKEIVENEVYTNIYDRHLKLLFLL